MSVVQANRTIGISAAYLFNDCIGDAHFRCSTSAASSPILPRSTVACLRLYVTGFTFRAYPRFPDET